MMCMSTSNTLRTAAARPAATRRSERSQGMTVRASAREERAQKVVVPRRDLLLAGAVGLGAVSPSAMPLLWIIFCPVSRLLTLLSPATSNAAQMVLPAMPAGAVEYQIIPVDKLIKRESLATTESCKLVSNAILQFHILCSLRPVVLHYSVQGGDASRD